MRWMILLLILLTACETKPVIELQTAIDTNSSLIQLDVLANISSETVLEQVEDNQSATNTTLQNTIIADNKALSPQEKVMEMQEKKTNSLNLDNCPIHYYHRTVAYSRCPGKCYITSIMSMNKTGMWGTHLTKVKYIFVPNGKLVFESGSRYGEGGYFDSVDYVQQAIKDEWSLTFFDGKDASQEFIDAYDIQLMNHYTCNMTFAEKGTGTPIGFKFLDFDLNKDEYLGIK